MRDTSAGHGKRLIGAAWALLCAALLASGAGCYNQSSGGAQGGGGGPSGPPLFSSLSELQPDALPGEEAQMVLQGVELPVKLMRKQSGENVRLVLTAHDEVFEEEGYQSSDESFALTDAAGETWSPAIPLLRTPLKDTDEWTWDGVMTAGGVERKASATITTSQDQVQDGSQFHRAVRVDVNLSMASGGKEPASRRLSFWFVPGKGVLKREFGVGSKREPLSPPEEEAAEDQG